MRVCVFARCDLVSTASGVYDKMVLLEGLWPEGFSSRSGWALDDDVDARFDWIDEAAVYWAERLGSDADFEHAGGQCAQSIGPHWLNALALRYYLAKLIRVVAYFTEVRPLGYGDIIKFVGVRGRDEDYGDLFLHLCRNASAALRVRWVDRRRQAGEFFPPNGRFRRGLAAASMLLEPRAAQGARGRRVVLCGNARLLAPVCRELIVSGGRVWWLYDRFAPWIWLRWRPAGAGQLVCNSGLAVQNRLVDRHSERVECRGVDLAEPIARWVAKRLQTLGPRQTRILEQIEAHFRRIEPHALVLDEDATPFARAAVAIARRYGVRSCVVPDGAPCNRFGFAPPAADYVLTWDRSGQLQAPTEGGSGWRLADWRKTEGEIRKRGDRERLESESPRLPLFPCPALPSPPAAQIAKAVLAAAEA